MSRQRGHDNYYENGFPRVSGDEPAQRAAAALRDRVFPA